MTNSTPRPSGTGAERGTSKPPRAFVFGNAAMDEVFDLSALPVPGQSVLARASHAGLGGKGVNQAVALGRCGIATTLVAPIGRDHHGDRIAGILADEPLDAVLIRKEGTATDRSIILTAEGGGNVVVTTNDCASALSPDDCRRVLDALGPGDVVVMQGNLSAETTMAIARAARRSGARLALNPSPLGPGMHEVLPLADIVFANEDEAEALTGLSGEDAAAALGASARAALTLGAAGALLAADGAVVHIPAVPARAVDTTAAGDCFAGVALASAAMRGVALDRAALAHAATAAALTVLRPGAVAALPDGPTLAAIMAGHRPAALDVP